MEIETIILDILKAKGMRVAQEYEVSMPIAALEEELARLGFAHDRIRSVIMQLCVNGVLAMDEMSVYLYGNA
ncbi:hypothetical protein [Taibaiella chishuiensis]|uniref:Uncharacterized protein n=1 Tax=Taibaiella chishuiensis TaxID=1434707 RepID=A0A2P8D365_9BACT|nr:hypothetical protein [Taibaiella chishuiensis]PSK91667.1 hypothetical protein B0I18_105252 [Taibaiella chishuiensis]